MVAVVRSTVVDAPVDDVWRVLRDFDSHRDWHPAVADSRIEGGRRGWQVGCVRAFTLADGGGFLRERLVALSDLDRRLVYCLLDTPIPLLGYVATIELKPVTDGGRTFWRWSSVFETPAGREAELAALVGDGIYAAGFDGLRRHLGRAGPVRRPPAAARTEVPLRETAPRRRAAAPAPAPAGPSAAGQTVRAEAVVLTGHGGPERLSVRTVDVPPPGPGEVRLRQTAVGVNYIDVYCRTGFFDLVAPGGVLGMEAAGVVADVGPGVPGLAVGDRVAYACPPPGAYAALRTMDAALLVPLPDGVDDETAAAVMLKGMTAEFLLHRVHRVREGDRVLVHAAAGGVGLLLCQWARRLGATVIGTVGSREKAALARRHGCAYPVVRGEDDFLETVRTVTGGEGCDVVYDAVGRDTFERSLAALAVRGHLVSYGQASGPVPPADVSGWASRSVTVSRPNFGHYTGTPDEVRSITDRLFDALGRGDVRVEIGRRLRLHEAAEAHRLLEGRATTGSTVLLP